MEQRIRIFIGQLRLLFTRSFYSQVLYKTQLDDSDVEGSNEPLSLRLNQCFQNLKTK